MEDLPLQVIHVSREAFQVIKNNYGIFCILLHAFLYPADDEKCVCPPGYPGLPGQTGPAGRPGDTGPAGK